MFYRSHIAVACHIVRRGGVIAYPTEGVFGLGCDPFQRAAVQRILAIKNRAAEKGLILVADNITRFNSLFGEISQNNYQLMTDSWPGPQTWVVPHDGNLPYWITGGRATVAIRVSAHPTVAQLCEKLQSPLVSTSANRSGKSALTTQLQVRSQLHNDIDYLVPGHVSSPGKASQITDLISGASLRT